MSAPPDRCLHARQLADSGELLPCATPACPEGITTGQMYLRSVIGALIRYARVKYVLADSSVARTAGPAEPSTVFFWRLDR